MRKLIVILVLSVACSTPYRKDDTIDRELAAAQAKCLERVMNLGPKGVVLQTRSNPTTAGADEGRKNAFMVSCMRSHGYSR